MSFQVDLSVSSIEVYLVVEGQTEQTFVRDVLAPEMAHKGIYLHPALIGKPGHKGGDIRFERAREDIGNFLAQRSDTYISMMLDYFRIDAQWPGRPEVRQNLETGATLTALQKAEILEAATMAEIAAAFSDHNADKRFIPYFQMHEFEAVLFSDPQVLAKVVDVDPKQVQEIMDQYVNPEEINDDPVKAPSKRLYALKRGYRKVAIGKAVAEAIGIQKIRARCPCFNQWLKRLEDLPGDAHDQAFS
jgi:hypothetical protein